MSGEMLAMGGMNMASNIIGSAIGAISASQDRAAARKVYEEMQARLDNVDLPDIEKQQLVLEELKQQGVLTPEMEQEIIAKSNFQDVSSDPRLKMEQEASLAALSEIADSGGLRAQDRARLEEIKSGIATQERGQREAVMQGMRRRGMQGSGMDLAAQLQTQQGAADRTAREGFNLAGQAQERALQAILARGDVAGSMRGQDFGEQMDLAKARQAIEQFNTANRIGVQGRNIDRRNIAAESNLSEKQRVSDTNVGTRNYEQEHNKGLYQQRFDNEMAKASGVNAASGNMANSYNQSADSKAKMWTGLGRNIGRGFTSYGNYAAGSNPSSSTPSDNYTYNYQPSDDYYA